MSKKCIAGIAANIPTDPSMNVNYIDKAINETDKPEDIQEALRQFYDTYDVQDVQEQETYWNELTQQAESQVTSEMDKKESNLVISNFKYNELTKLFNLTEEGRDIFKETTKALKFEQHPEVANAAYDLVQGDITKKEFDAIVDRYLPITPITLKTFPKTSNFKKIMYALNKDKVAKGVVNTKPTKGFKYIEDGTRISSRLDIPAYEKFNEWVVSLHNAGKGGSSIGYGKTAVLTNVDFTIGSFDDKGGPGPNQTAASRIAMGQRGKDVAPRQGEIFPKSPFARMEGDWNNVSSENAIKLAKAALQSDGWVQVGMNPYRASYFYDKANGNPVVSADVLIQVGPLVMAKGVKYGSREDYTF